MIPKEAVRRCRDLSRALRSKRRDPQEGGLHEADVHHLPARPPGRANAWGHSCEHVRGTPPKPRRPSRAAWMSSPMSSLRMTIIMMVSYISCPFPAKAEALLPCACTEAPLPLKRPGEEGSARCSLLEFRQLQKWPILWISKIWTPKKGDTSRDPKTRVRYPKRKSW